MMKCKVGKISHFSRKQHIKPLKSRKIEKEYEETDYTAWKLSAAAGKTI